MRAERILATIPAATFALTAIFFAGCTGTSAPGGWLPSAEETSTNTYGAWARVSLVSAVESIEGELIAATHDSVFLLLDKLTVVPRDSIENIKLTRYAQEHRGIVAWTIWGSVSTLSHGYFAAISLPTWVLSGSIVAGAASREPIMQRQRRGSNPIDGTALRRLAPYARFPQGIPQAVDRLSLRPKL